MAKAGAFMDDLVGTVTKAAKGIESNKAINPLNKGIGNFTGGIEGVGRVLNGEGFGTAMKNTFGKMDDTGKLLTGEKAGWNNKKIAGSFLGASAVGRIATGGGVYKDGNGNTNLVGVPFV